MGITPTSQAAGLGSSIQNQSFAVTPQRVPRKIVIVGTYDPGKTDVVPDTLYGPVLSAEEVGAYTGFGYMLHRLAERAFMGSQGIETWIIPQLEDIAGVQASGFIDFTGSISEGGTIHLYIGGILHRPVEIPTVSGAVSTEICSDTVDAINAIKELPVTAAIDGGDPSRCNITAKSKGLLWGNGMTISFNRRPGEAMPPGIVAAVASPLSGGSATYDIQPALDAMGIGDNKNEKFFTDFIHGYPYTAQWNDILAYVGPGNEKSGTYSELVHKPFQTLQGSALPGSSGLSAILGVAELRKGTDRANGFIAVAGSYSMPEEISAQVMGVRARVANIRPEQNYVDQILQNIDPGDPEDRWTDDYNNRDLAVKGGISPTLVKNGQVYLQNLVTFYHPDSVPAVSNGYASFRDLAIIQNLLDSQYRTFNTEKWKNFTIVNDVTKVTDPVARLKARDIDGVRDECIALLKAWYALAWIYETDFAIDWLADPLAITIRSGTDGFNIDLKIILSGEGNIIDVQTFFDTSIAVLTA